MCRTKIPLFTFLLSANINMNIFYFLKILLYHLFFLSLSVACYNKCILRMTLKVKWINVFSVREVIWWKKVGDFERGDDAVTRGQNRLVILNSFFSGILIQDRGRNIIGISFIHLYSRRVSLRRWFLNYFIKKSFSRDKIFILLFLLVITTLCNLKLHWCSYSLIGF